MPAKTVKVSEEPTVHLDVPPIDTPLDLGLNQAQVEERMKNGYANINTVSATKTVREIFKSNIFTYFNLIFVVLAIILILVGAYTNLFFMVIVIANAFIGIIQELRSKRSVDKLTILAEAKVNVLRDGKWEEVPSSKLVRDDIVEFRNGDQICADAIVRSGELSVNEALLTGESDAIKKNPGDTLKSGSACSAGRGVCQLTHVGSESYASQLTIQAKSNMKVGKSDMMKSLDQLIKAIGIAIIPVGILLFLREYFGVGLDIKESVRYTVAAVIGMIPEGLYLLTSMALAVSVVRLAKRKVLVRDMSCVETLARVDTLCVDKTGTITEPGMDVQKLIIINEKQFPQQTLTDMLSAFYHNMPADNDTALAMFNAFGQSEAAPAGWNVSKVIPFSSDYKWSGMTFADKGTYIIGAPEFILGDRVSEVSAKIAPWAQQGMRVLLIAHTDKSVLDAQDNVSLDKSSVVPAALVCITNRIRDKAKETFEFFEQQGVTVKVISGDAPLTVAEVARHAGINGADNYVDATTLQTDEDIYKAAAEKTVFGRVTPQQKLALVKALKAQGHVVAMTGDGVNDVLALKEADCGIAMASGSQAASQISKLVLLDSDFKSMPSIVDEGRRVINNIQRSASLFLTKNIFSFVFALLTIIIGFTYPMQPNQLSMISSVTIGVPGFWLAMQINHTRVEGKFLRNVMYRAMPGAVSDIVLILGVEAFAYAFGLSAISLSTAAAIVMLTVGLIVIYETAKPLDKYRACVLGLSIAMAVTGVFILPHTPFAWMVEMGHLDIQNLLIALVFGLLAFPCMKATLFLSAKAKELWLKHNEKKAAKAETPAA